MTWIIAILAVAAVLGSVMWLKPSPLQQRQARLRLRARQLGLDVRLAPLPQTRRARVRQQEAEPGVVYRLLRFDLNGPLAHDVVLVRENAGSEWERLSAEPLSASVETVLKDVLGRMPADVAAVELTAHGPGIYWRERGDEQTVELLRSSMEQLLESLSAA